MKAFVHIGGKIEIARQRPDSTCAMFAEGPAKLLRKAVMMRARMGYDGVTLLMPGVPEAESAVAEFEAVAAFAVQIALLIERLKTS